MRDEDNKERCWCCDKEVTASVIEIREMMFGTRDLFEYDLCPSCNSIQINSVPEDMKEYYPKEYSRYALPQEPKEHTYMKVIRKLVARVILSESNYLQRVIVSMFFTSWAAWFQGLRIGFSEPILDVGAGNGGLLLNLSRYGFTNLLGIDPYIEKDIIFSNGVTVRRLNIEDITGTYSLIIFNHSLEHINKPLEVLTQASNLLKDGGTLIISVPVIGGMLWKEYGTNWVALDAPRHLFLPSEAGMRILADRAGFEIARVVYNSTNYEIVGSELFRRNISFANYSQDKARLFTKNEIKNFDNRIKILNRGNASGMATFVLRGKKPVIKPAQ